MKKTKRFILFSVSSAFAITSFAQKATDVTAPLHALQPDYPVAYIIPQTSQVKNVLDKVYHYLDSVTPPRFINKQTRADVRYASGVDTNTIFAPADFRLTSYEWGVAYIGMLQAAEATGDNRYADYTKQRLQLIAESLPAFTQLYQQYPRSANPLRQPVAPHALDDAGAMCAAMIKTLRNGGHSSLRPVINKYIDYISKKEFRFPDGTLARNRPQKNTLWLDDLYMSVPALAQMGKLTGEKNILMTLRNRCFSFPKECSTRNSAFICTVGFRRCRSILNSTGHVPMAGP